MATFLHGSDQPCDVDIHRTPTPNLLVVEGQRGASRIPTLTLVVQRERAEAGTKGRLTEGWTVLPLTDVLKLQLGLLKVLLRLL